MATTKTKVRARKPPAPPATKPGVTPLAPEADLAVGTAAMGDTTPIDMKTEHSPSDGRFVKKGGGSGGGGRTRTRRRTRKETATRTKNRNTERERVVNIQKAKNALEAQGIRGIPRALDPETRRADARSGDAPMLLTARPMAAPAPAPAFNPVFKPTPAVTLAAPDRVKPWR